MVSGRGIGVLLRDMEIVETPVYMFVGSSAKARRVRCWEEEWVFGRNIRSTINFGEVASILNFYFVIIKVFMLTP